MSKAWWLGIGLMMACGGSEPTDDDTDVAETDETDGGNDGSTLTGDIDAILALDPDLAAGEAGYTTNCVLCHVADGTGATGPDLTGADAREIAEAMIEGPGAMTSAADLELVDQDVADIAAYAESL